MEIKLNKDIQKLQDSFFIGLNFRQTVFGGLGLALGALIYLETTKHGINTELASWICIAVVAPFAALGFVTYHGMPFEQLVRVWVKHYILCPKRIVFRLENDFYNRDKMRIEAAEKNEATSDE